jgi:hypothetical protein
MDRPDLTCAQRMRELADSIDLISEADRKHFERIAREGVR